MERPRIKIEKSLADRLIEGLVLAGAIAAWVYPWIVFSSLTDRS
jgi:hypothetical protein